MKSVARKAIVLKKSHKRELKMQANYLYTYKNCLGSVLTFLSSIVAGIYLINNFIPVLQLTFAVFSLSVSH